MANGWFELDGSGIDELERLMDNYGSFALRAIDAVFHNEAAEIIKEKIQPLIPESGRKWKGKKTAAARTQPFTQDTSEMLAVTVKSRPAYQYLYFPDDGSNTIHHAGNQQFMKRGAENATAKIIEICTGRLVEEFKEG
ncbi:MAG: hypothetical protein ACI4TK_08395 [Agathobacter sp.]